MPAANAKAGLADTFSRLLRLDIAAGGPRLGLTELLDESEAHLERLAQKGEGEPAAAAARLLASPLEYTHWLRHHEALMERIARVPRAGLQVHALLSLAFRLVHRCALFEYLRTSAPRGARRRAIVRHFHGDAGYTHAMIREHAQYLRSVASLSCVRRIGMDRLERMVFGEPLRDYERRYAEYFAGYCATIPASPGTGAGSADPGAVDGDEMRALLDDLKREVLAVRDAMLADPRRLGRTR